MDTVARGEIAESGLDNFIAQRDKQRRREEGERPAEAMWAESCRVYADGQRREMRARWYAFHMDQAERIERTAAALAGEHRARAEALMGDGAV